MILLIEDKLNYIKYSDNSAVIKKTKLGLELHSDKWSIPLPNSWDFEINDNPSNVTIHVQDIVPPFIVEGNDCLYYVFSKDGVRSIEKTVLFIEAIKQTIGDDIINTAHLNGYDTSERNRNERIFYAAAIILNNAPKHEECIFRIPYLLDPDFSTVREDPDYNAIPNYYVINEIACTKIEKILSNSIKEHLQFDQQYVPLPVYSYSWFISKTQLT